MTGESTPEYWLLGPVPGVPELLQPVAHALLQARKEVLECVSDFPEELLWEQPAGLASVGFHLQHLAGVIDRLFTYANKEQLSAEQLTYLSLEGKPDTSIASLASHFDRQVNTALEQLTTIDVSSLTETRGVGRKQIPSTVLGLLFHAAEHTMRHTGQLLVTIRILKDYTV